MVSNGGSAAWIAIAAVVATMAGGCVVLQEDFDTTLVEAEVSAAVPGYEASASKSTDGGGLARVLSVAVVTGSETVPVENALAVCEAVTRVAPPDWTGRVVVMFKQHDRQDGEELAAWAEIETGDNGGPLGGLLRSGASFGGTVPELAAACVDEAGA